MRAVVRFCQFQRSRSSTACGDARALPNQRFPPPNAALVFPTAYSLWPTAFFFSARGDARPPVGSLRKPIETREIGLRNAILQNVPIY